MADSVILRTNAIPVYGFLSRIAADLPDGETLAGRTILDCGAGGPLPPLALFCQHGFQTWGIDASQAQLERAQQFCAEQGLKVDLRLGDMRQLPFEDDTFDYVYEHYSMCHLSKRDTARAVSEMIRALKPGGLSFLGVISKDTWPLSTLGQEREPGEYWGDEGGEETLHSAFTDSEANALVSTCEIVHREKHVRYLSRLAEGLSMEAWMGLRQEADPVPTEEAWRAQYGQRANAYRYAHLYYCVRKP